VDLKEYQRKRRFQDTPEPSGAVGAGRGAPRFVVQEHHARRVHWDLRLEMDGVLRSWAIPKGPSLDPADKRLAVLVEDHPIEYGEFEGIIPQGNYGAGTVMLWDRGTYACREGDPSQAFQRGKMTLVFSGEKLRGEFHFVRTRRNAGRDWLLFKGKDEFATSGYSPSGTRSVVSGRLIDEIRADQDARWTAAAPASRNRAPAFSRSGTPAAAPAPPPAAPHRRPAAVSRSRGRAHPASRRRGASAPARRKDASTAPRRSARADPFPEPFRPMLAKSADRPFSRPGWFFEVKWDGVRTLAFVRRRGAVQEVSLYSRTLLRLNAQFPEIVEALSRMQEDSIVLDGEVIAPDERGQPSFARLQQRFHLSRDAEVREAGSKIQIAYAVFDCLYLAGRDLRGRPFSERRRVLEGLTLPAGLIRGDVVEENGLTLYAAVREHNLEGIIAKKAASPYRPGVRSPDWLKIKRRQTLEAVVAGMTRGKGLRTRTFGALVLGQYDPKTGALVHIGQTGGGLTDADLRLLRERLEPLITATSPFASPPRTLTPATWVRPEVVVEVEYGERTPDGMLRFPVFLRVRDDLPAREVRMPIPAPAHPAPRAPAPGPAGQASAAAPTPPPIQNPPRGRRDAESPIPAGLPEGLAFTNLDKVFFPERGSTKGDVIAWYHRIAPYILPHLKDRPLSLRRFPDGITGKDFFQKDVPDAPAFVRAERIWSDQGDRDIRMVVGADEAELLWLAQMGCIEMHPWFSRISPVRRRADVRPATSFSGSEDAIAQSVLNYPDFVVFDIDPFIFPPGTGPVLRHGEHDPDYTRGGFEAARRAALWLGEALEALDLRAFAKTSGKTGLHVFVPVVRRYTYAQTHAFAKTMTTWLVGQHPAELTTAWGVEERVGKVFLDYNQNVRGKTLASVYSLRPVPEATVSVPVTWAELRAGFDPLAWTMTTVFDRLGRVGDLWADILKAAQSLDIPSR
jgi:bifunctional non-homologous end joining protein LigD